MRTLHRYIEAKGCQFLRHPLFSRLERMESAQHLKAMASTLTFWVMNYQDLLRLNEDRMEDPAMRKLARLHRTEEAGHERWFLEDLSVLDAASQPEVRSLFSAQQTPARDATHALLAEVFRAQNDAERLSVLLVCEFTSKFFFERVDAQVRRIGLHDGLKFFSGVHLEAERNHSAFEERLPDLLSTFTLSGPVRASAFSAVDRTFAAFTQLFDGVDVALVRAGVTRKGEYEDVAEASAA